MNFWRNISWGNGWIFRLMQTSKTESWSNRKAEEIDYLYTDYKGLTCSSVGKESAYNSRDLGLISELGRSDGEGNSNPLQYACLGNPMDRGASCVHEVTRVGHDLATKTITTEIKTIIKMLCPNKSPGPRGITGEFSQIFNDLIPIKSSPINWSGGIAF